MNYLISVKDYFLEIYINLHRSISYPYTFLLTVLCGVLLLRDLRITKDSFRIAFPRLVGELALCAAGAILIQCLMFAALGSGILVYQASVLVFLLLYALFRSNYNFYTRITMTAIYYAAGWGIWRLVNGMFLTNDVLFPNGPRWAEDITSMLRVTALTVGTVIFLKRFSERKTRRVPRIYWMLILFISLASVVTFIVIDALITEGLNDYPNFSTYMAVIFLTINLLTYYMFWVMTTEHRKNTEDKVLSQKASDDNDAMAKNESMYQNIRALRHDLKNHIGFMRTLLAQKNYDELDKYFRQLTSEDFAPLHDIDCGNAVVNTILNNELMIANSRGVRFESFIGVPPELTVQDKDMCSLLSNILDNAIEAASRAKVPVVNLSMKIVNDFLFVKCANSMAENVFLTNPQLKTTKADKSEHGLGVRVIGAIADRYSGQALFEEENGSFVVTVMLMLPESKAA